MTSSREVPPRIVGGVVVALVLGMLACQQADVAQEKAGPSTAQRFAASPDSVECAHQATGFTTPAKKSGFVMDCLRRIRMARALGREAERLAGLTLLIPEFHDEQRFAVSETEYGPVAMVFASPNIDGFVQTAQWAEHGTRGVLSAVVMVDDESTEPMGPAYEQLGLRRGINCIWISLTGATGATAGAYVTWAKENEACRPSDPGAPGDPVEPSQKLAVVRRDFSASVSSAREVPPVARFTWSQDGQPLIGVRCAVGWCDVGPLPPTGASMFEPRSRIVDAIKVPAIRTLLTSALGGDLGALNVEGWYDEQPLAEFVDGKIVPGKLWVTIIPVHRTYTSIGVLSGDKARPVAVLFVHGDPSTTRYGKAPWSLQRFVNVVSLRTDAAGANGFIANVEAAGDLVRWTNVFRHPHYDAAVIPTARFRWASTDDGLWVACGQACCRIDGES